jgi:pilus assembly protein Flp/PilA
VNKMMNNRRQVSAPLVPHKRRAARGQALVEYVVIIALIAIALIGILTITGPAVGNVFSNVLNYAGVEGGTLYPTYENATIVYIASRIAGTLPPLPYQTNSPIAPTCASAPGTFAPRTSTPGVFEGCP